MENRKIIQNLLMFTIQIRMRIKNKIKPVKSIGYNFILRLVKI
jgi:hypothetical protein